MFRRYNRTRQSRGSQLESETTLTNSAETGPRDVDRALVGLAALSLGAAQLSRLERTFSLDPIQGILLDRQNTRSSAAYRRDSTRRLSLAPLWRPSTSIRSAPTLQPNRGSRAGSPVSARRFSITDTGAGHVAVRRDVTPNLQIAQNTVNDNITLAAAIPLPWLDDTRRRAPKLIGLASVGVQRTRLIDSVTAETTSSIDAARIDAAVTYLPRPGVTYTLRYEGQFQRGDSESELDLPGFYRNTIYFAFSVRYPNDIAGVVPSAAPATRTAPPPRPGTDRAEPVSRPLKRAAARRHER